MNLTRAADRIDHLDIAAALRSGANVAALVRDLGARPRRLLHRQPSRRIHRRHVAALRRGSPPR